MKKHIFLLVLLCYSTLTLAAPPTSTVPVSSSSSISSTTTTVYESCANDWDCDDYNPCTDDQCLTNSLICIYYSNPPQTPCDDGLYCNGVDTCEDGDCSVHSGDPCTEGTACNENTDSCDPNPVTSTTTSIDQTTTSTSMVSDTTTTLLTGDSFSISGYVIGAINEDVSVQLSGTASETGITDIQGYYEFSNLASGFYTIKPEKDGYSFEPPNYIIQNLTSDLADMDFEATKTRCPTAAIYGERSQETKFLRYFRDNVLSKTQEGQELIKLYYQWSPVIVKAMEADEGFREELKEIIDAILEMIE